MKVNLGAFSKRAGPGPQSLYHKSDGFDEIWYNLKGVQGPAPKASSSKVHPPLLSGSPALTHALGRRASTGCAFSFHTDCTLPPGSVEVSGCTQTSKGIPFGETCSVKCLGGAQQQCYGNCPSDNMTCVYPQQWLPVVTCGVYCRDGTKSVKVKLIFVAVDSPRHAPH